MPRGTKESEDEFEPRGRRTRATASSVTDSPLRRSTRNRRTTKDDNSSPESVTSDAGPPTRTRRRIITTLDSAPFEPVRSLRSRKTSTTSDVSEATESENGGEARTRSTRRSSVVPLGIETPTKARLRRTTRAGSESKTLSPVVRITRRTRASSVDPDNTEDRPPTTPSTPMRSRKQRAAVQPSEPSVVEEIEKPKPSDTEDDDVFVLDETIPNKSSTLSQKDKSINSVNTDDETREALEASLEALISNTTTRDSLPAPPTPQQDLETRQKLMENASDNASKDLPKVLVEKAQIIEKQETNPGNKENEKTPRSADRPLKLFKASSTKPMVRKSLNPIVLERIDVDSRLNVSVDEKLLKSQNSNSKNAAKLAPLESEPVESLSVEAKEEKEDSIIFIDDTDTDEADRAIELSNDKSAIDKNQIDDEIIITPIANDELSPCKSQFPKRRSVSPRGDDADDVDESCKLEVPEDTKKIDTEQVENDSTDTNLKSFFKDIPADDWQKGTSDSPVNVEDDDGKRESDGELDLVLVGKGGWSGDENETEEKIKDNFNYDSDETVIVSKKLEMPEGAAVIPEEPMDIDDQDTEIDDPDETEKMNSSQRKSLKLKTPVKEKKTDNHDDDDDNTDDDHEITPEVEEQLNKSRELIYAFESGIPVGGKIDDKSEENNVKNSEVEEILNRSGKITETRKSVGKSGDDDKNSQVMNLDKSRKSISSSELRKSLSKSRTPGKDRNSLNSNVKVGDDDDEKSSEVEESLNISRKSLPGRSSLTKAKTPVERRFFSISSSDNEEEIKDKSVSDETPSKSRKSLSRKSTSESKTPLKNKEETPVVNKEETSSKAEETVNKSRKSIGPLSELRVCLSRSKTPVKAKESSSSEEEEEEEEEVEEIEIEENSKLEDSLNKSKKTSPRKSLPAAKTPPKLQNDEQSSSEDEDPENITKRFTKPKMRDIKSYFTVDKLKSPKADESSEKAGEDEEILNKSTSSTKRSSLSLKTPQKEDEELKKVAKTSPQKWKSLMDQKSSSSSNDDDDDDDDDDKPDDDEHPNSKMGKRSLSTVVNLNSDPEADEVSDSDVEQSRIVSSFLYAVDTDSSSSDADCDIRREYNLDGASVEKYSDDDVPGDDCRVSESEESDSDDDGDDLDDFLVNTDEEEDDSVSDDLLDNSAEEEDEHDDDDDEDEDDDDHDKDDDDDDDNDHEIEESPPKEIDQIPELKKKNREEKSLNSSTPNPTIQDRQSESAKKSKKNLPLEIVVTTPKPSTPSRIIELPTENLKQTSNSPPKSTLPVKKLKSGKKTEMNQTLVLDNSALADTRLLMKEKLNDSMPILKMKRLSSRKSDLEVLSEDKIESFDQEKKALKKKIKLNKPRISGDEILQEIPQNIEDVDDKKSKKNTSIKRTKTTIDLMAPEAPKTKKTKIQVVKLADSDSDEPQVVSFHEARAQALAAVKKEQESVKAGKEAKKMKIKSIAEKSQLNPSAGVKKTIKRLSEEVLDNLPDVPLRPKKKRKINNDVFMPSRTMYDDENKKPRGLSIDDEYMPISLSGGTTSFEVVSLKKSKESKKSSSRTFRERMMNRVSRQPISAFSVHQQKLKASGKNKY